MKTDSYWMQKALGLARRAEAEGEVPVGAIIVRNNVVLGQGWNHPIISHDPTAHAEIHALKAACSHVQNYRIPESTLYVSLEPCIMCAGAIVHARIERVVFAAKEPKSGAAGSCFDIFNTAELNHRVICEHGLLAEESSALLRNFFRIRR